jgi:electron transport complex protein RnfA
MGAAVAFVLTLSTMVTYLLQIYVLNPFGLQYLQTLAFILVIAALVQMVEIILKKVSPALYQALGIFLPLITTNCAVLGVAILVIQKDFSLLESVVYALFYRLRFRSCSGRICRNQRANGIGKDTERHAGHGYYFGYRQAC